jgi:CTP:phosphocholine cytidylyltransferase-like protein
LPKWIHICAASHWNKSNDLQMSLERRKIRCNFKPCIMSSKYSISQKEKHKDEFFLKKVSVKKIMEYNIGSKPSQIAQLITILLWWIT